jgi:Raf kinase inhibitor-like YbhB/YbcL family protein
MTLAITSPEFADGAAIPRRFTADGEDLSPPLAWVGAPPGTRSFALIVDDPDAPDPRSPQRTWVHWVVYDLPRDVLALDAGADLPSGARAGQNDWGRADYGGPAPPVGRHRYFHKLYALDTVLGRIPRPTKAALEQAMKGHVLAEAQLVGTYAHR